MDIYPFANIKTGLLPKGKLYEIQNIKMTPGKQELSMRMAEANY